MSMKSFVGKIFGKKQSPMKQSEEKKETQHEIPEESLVAEKKTEDKRSCTVDVYIHDEKTDSYDILPATETRIGRDPSLADISIPELIVSKLHCTLYFKHDAVFIKDHDSTNGTYVNGQKIAEQMLENNDLITLGKKGTVHIIFHKQ